MNSGKYQRAKAFAGGGLVCFTLSKTQRTLAYNDLTVVLLGAPIAHVTPVDADFT